MIYKGNRKQKAGHSVVRSWASILMKLEQRGEQEA